MAIQKGPREGEKVICPRCRSSELLFIDGYTVRWATCPKCKFKKLMEQEKKTIKVVPL